MRPDRLAAEAGRTRRVGTAWRIRSEAALLLGELVHVEIPAEQLTHVHRHRAVEEYRKVENAPRSLAPIEVKEQRLRTVDGEGGYDDRAAPRCPPRDDVRQRVLGIPWAEPPAPVGRLEAGAVGV